ncbi:DUF4279 domain-containing protein [Aequorivita lipolytica]|uniref:DUF4279 domain-containing protein n=1 Tax=Aequorivita lipolytica TaxID=153267 RepID=A0A5C6YRN8_9FLAO|nr:DUF4279 domain-containing protein [Aequorivita lipolytica]TXD69664.1 DUF4279 domain-containing protein [Aequorivita lipolytica]SRX51157.1 hypothetical protein AEQU2_01637 [Aequorivita lipolytica]
MKNETLQDFTFYDYSAVEISFSIKTKTLDLQTLTDFLKLNPTRGWTNGEKYIGRQLNTDTKQIETIERQKPWTMFAYETKEIVNSDRFQVHAIHLLEKLDEMKNNLKDLVAQPDKFEILIQVYLQFDKDQNHFGFSSETELLKRLSEYCHQIEWRNK